jgi:hypothetical protein
VSSNSRNEGWECVELILQYLPGPTDVSTGFGAMSSLSKSGIFSPITRASQIMRATSSTFLE